MGNRPSGTTDDPSVLVDEYQHYSADNYKSVLCKRTGNLLVTRTPGATTCPDCFKKIAELLTGAKEGHNEWKPEKAGENEKA